MANLPGTGKPIEEVDDVIEAWKEFGRRLNPSIILLKKGDQYVVENGIGRLIKDDPERRLARYLEDNPPFHTQDRDYERGKSMRRRMFETPCYEVPSGPLLVRLVKSSRECLPGEEIRMICGIPHIMKGPGKMGKIFRKVWDLITI